MPSVIPPALVASSHGPGSLCSTWGLQVHGPRQGAGACGPRVWPVGMFRALVASSHSVSHLDSSSRLAERSTCAPRGDLACPVGLFHPQGPVLLARASGAAQVGTHLALLWGVLCGGPPAPLQSWSRDLNPCLTAWVQQRGPPCLPRTLEPAAQPSGTGTCGPALPAHAVGPGVEVDIISGAPVQVRG